MQVDETETKNFKRLDDQELEDLELQDDKKNNFKIKWPYNHQETYEKLTKNGNSMSAFGDFNIYKKKPYLLKR